MSYFNQFPKLFYSINGETKLTTDILVRAKTLSRIVNSVDFISTFTVQDGMRPEHIAAKVYGDPFLHWVILLFNEIHDPFFQWPLSQLELFSYCSSVYGSDVMYQVRHYEDKDGNIIGEYKEFDKENEFEIWIQPPNPEPLNEFIYPVTHLEYEERLNDERRQIKILRPELLQDFLSQHRSLIIG